MYRLYGRKGAGSAAVEALLAVLDVPHEVNFFEKTDGKMPASFLALNPRGEVPALQLPDGRMMTESAAMMIHLADTHSEAGLAPAISDAARPHYLRWMLYVATAPYMSDLRMYYPARFSTDASHAAAIKAKAIIDLGRDFDLLAAQMGDGPYLLGNRMSAADIYAAMILSWSNDVDGLFARHGKLKTLYAGVAAHPAIRAVWDRNDMP